MYLPSNPAPPLSQQLRPPSPATAAAARPALHRNGPVLQAPSPYYASGRPAAPFQAPRSQRAPTQGNGHPLLGHQLPLPSQPVSSAAAAASAAMASSMVLPGGTSSETAAAADMHRQRSAARREQYRDGLLHGHIEVKVCSWEMGGSPTLSVSALSLLQQLTLATP